ncbi:MAG: hypothetical protein AAGJ79_04050 [Verrucomicrobiota bacterium]
MIPPSAFPTLIAAAALALTGCKTDEVASRDSSGGRSSTLGKVLVVNQVSPTLTRHVIALTAFGNKTETDIPLADVRDYQTEEFRQELSPFSRSVETLNLPSEEDLESAEIAKLGREFGVDMIVVIHPGNYYPYGVPSYMKTTGYGQYSRVIGKRSPDDDIAYLSSSYLLFDAPSGKRIDRITNAFKKTSVLSTQPYNVEYFDNGKYEYPYSNYSEAQKRQAKTALKVIISRNAKLAVEKMVKKVSKE